MTGGFWGRRLSMNRDVTIPRGFRQLTDAGNLATAPYRELPGPSLASTVNRTS